MLFWCQLGRFRGSKIKVFHGSNEDLRNATGSVKHELLRTRTVSCPQISQATYVYGERGVRACPSGYSTITDPAACEIASNAIGDPYMSIYNDGADDANCNGGYKYESSVEGHYSASGWSKMAL